MREKLRELFIAVFERKLSVDEAMSSTEEIVDELIGEDNKMTDSMPVRWQPALKKQFVNFRNHLRRELRTKWGRK